MEKALQSLLPERLDPFAGLMVGAAMALLIFVVGWIVSKWTHAWLLRLFRRSGLDEALGRFLASVARYSILVTAVLAALQKVGIESTSLLAVLGAAGLAVGLALQGSLSNFASGVMILLFRPFTIDHRITIAGHMGLVSDVGLFATTLVTADNDTIIIPNSAITSSSIVNHSTIGTRRANIAIGVAYGTDVDRTIEVIAEALRRTELVLQDPEPRVSFTGFGASSIDFLARPFSLPEDFAAMQSKARESIYEALNAAGIEIPFNQIVIHKAPA